MWVLRDGAPVSVSIKLGVSDGSTTEAAEGDLREGDEVITDAPTTEARPGGMGGGGMRRIL